MTRLGATRKLTLEDDMKNKPLRRSDLVIADPKFDKAIMKIRHKYLKGFIKRARKILEEYDPRRN